MDGDCHTHLQHHLCNINASEEGPCQDLRTVGTRISRVTCWHWGCSATALLCTPSARLGCQALLATWIAVAQLVVDDTSSDANRKIRSLAARERDTNPQHVKSGMVSPGQVLQRRVGAWRELGGSLARSDDFHASDLECERDGGDERWKYISRELAPNDLIIPGSGLVRSDCTDHFVEHQTLFHCHHIDIIQSITTKLEIHPTSSITL